MKKKIFRERYGFQEVKEVKEEKPVKETKVKKPVKEEK